MERHQAAKRLAVTTKGGAIGAPPFFDWQSDYPLSTLQNTDHLPETDGACPAFSRQAKHLRLADTILGDERKRVAAVLMGNYVTRDAGLEAPRMALYRNCKTCGARISLRKMPGGQWVAFHVGSDDAHHCFAPAPGAHHREPATRRHENIPSLLRTAIRQCRCVQIRYFTKSRGAWTDRVVEPLSIEGGLLKAYCHMRQEIRAFAIHNIHSATLLSETFAPRQVPTAVPTTIMSGAKAVSGTANTTTYQATPTPNYSWLIWVAVAVIVLFFFLAGR